MKFWKVHVTFSDGVTHTWIIKRENAWAAIQNVRSLIFDEKFPRGEVVSIVATVPTETIYG